LTAEERAELEAAAAGERRVRHWRRYRAVLLLTEADPTAVARTLGCSRASVYGRAAAWRRAGLAGLTEPPRAGRARQLLGAGEAALTALLATDPQAQGHHATGWTVPLLRTELARTGYAVSERTVRRTLHRLGWRWKRPKSMLGRPDPDYLIKRGRSVSRQRPC
jgi:transposase